MTTKEIRKALKAGKKLIFNRHIYGAPHGFERFPVVGVKEVHGLIWVKARNHGDFGVPRWLPVQHDLDDYVSVQFPPVQPVTFEPVPVQAPDSVDAREAREFRRML